MEDLGFRKLCLSVVHSLIFWRSCRFLIAMLRALRFFPGGLGRFIPCRIGANHCRLRAIGWERCGHDLTSRPLEASAPRALGSLLILFGYPAGSEGALIACRLRMRYCNVSFANKKPTWGLPREGKVADLIPKRIGLNKKTLVHDIGFLGREPPVPKRWKILRDPKQDWVDGDAGRRRIASEIDFREGIG